LLEIKFDGEEYFARLSIDQKKTVADAGFLWCDILGRWSTTRDRHAYRLIEFADSPTRQHILEKLDLELRSVPKIEYAPNRRKPFEHQLEGARWVLSRRASYIAYEAGLGKTFIASLCLNTIDGPAIIVCPSFLKLNWEDELESGLIDFHHIQILRKQSDKLNPNADIYIVPDSLLHVHLFRKQFFDLKKRFKYLFIDEAHRFKSADARRTMSLVGRREVKLKKEKEKVFWKGFHHIADHVINMSGTPMPNRPMELHALISRHAPHAMNYLDPHRFGVLYCGGFESEWGWDYSGATNLEDLHTILSRNYMTVKRKRDCLDMPKKLPPQFLFIEDDRGAKLRQNEMHVLETMKISDIIQNEVARNEKFKQRVEDMIEDNPSIGGFGFISELRKMLGVAKVPQAVAVIKEMLEDRQKLVVFCWHKEVADELCKRLADYMPLKIVGGISDKTRHAHVKAFQTESKFRILVANIQAGGVGITLTKSSRVLFVEPSWVPSDNDQAFDRIDRIGQAEEVQAFFLVVKHSLDHMILNAHQNKLEVIQAAIKPSL
jgi:SWI/SNF-related matrix-associated actin-dependent regulator 1 of chromatin subfamily A